jgi:hypothetical protein
MSASSDGANGPQTDQQWPGCARRPIFAARRSGPGGRRRSLGAVLKAALRPESYAAVVNALIYCERPLDFMRRYLFQTGTYPVDIRVRTPTGPAAITVYSSEDVLKIDTIFSEARYEQNPLKASHDIERRNWVATFRRRPDDRP